MAAEMIDLADWKPVISDEAFAYLAVQRGRESDLLGDRAAWEVAYRANLIELYRNIAPYLPRDGYVLDVGGGMSGISGLLAKHYHCPMVNLLDGLDAPPAVRSHGEPFSNFAVARDFLLANGLRKGWVHNADEKPGHFYSLVISFAAWCFHFPPSEYLAFVKSRLKTQATIILDIRKSRSDWRYDLEAAFGAGECICEGSKFERLVFRVA
jgi:hypothetical protein